MKEKLINQLKEDITDAWVNGELVFFAVHGDGLDLSLDGEIDIVRDEGEFFVQGEGFSIGINEDKISSVMYDGSNGAHYELDSYNGTSYIYDIPEEE